MTGSSDRPGAKAPAKVMTKEKPEKDSPEKEILEGLFPSVNPSIKTRLVPARAPAAGSASDRYRQRPQPDEAIEDSRMTAASETLMIDPTSSKTAQKILPRFEQKTDLRTAELKSGIGKEKPGAKFQQKSEGKVSLEPIRVQETIVGTRQTSTKPDVTSASQLKQRPTRTDVKALAAKKSRQTMMFRSVLALIAILLIGFAVQSQLSSGSGHAVGGDLSAPTDVFNDRVTFHKNDVGRRLNRERISVQYQNAIESGKLPAIVKKVPEPDILAGVPLAEEPHPPRERSRDHGEQTNPAYSDAYVQYSLQEQQQINEWERVAQKQYVDEFIANAARAGYKVKVDKAGNVSVVGRYPAAQGDAKPSTGKNGDSGPSGGGAIH